MKKIRVLRILNRFNLGGPTYNASLLTRYMPDEYETMLIGGPNLEDEHDSLHIPHNLGLKPTIIPELTRSVNVAKDLQALAKIKKIIKKFQPHIVHTHASKSGAIGRRAAHSMGVPIIVHTYHGHVFDAYFNGLISRFYKQIERNLASKTDAIIALSERQKLDLIEKHRICDEKQVSIIPLGFELDKFQTGMNEKRRAFREKYQLANDEIAIGIVGRMVPIKNHLMFIDAIRHLIEMKPPKFKIFIVGDGLTKPMVMERLSEYGIPYSENGHTPELVHFTSWQKEIDCVVAGLDVVALSSLNEGTPVSLIEAQAANCPIVSTRVGGIEDIVLENDTALLSASEDDMAFAENLYKLISDKELRERMSKNGRKFVTERFSYKTMVANMHILYKEMLGNIS
ncbi:MAG: glycosyltransferase [Bacteroidales bacterium]|nr:glycosyltransferase [Bacteroidales bacterium]